MTYQQLEALLFEYPYCQSLRFALLRKYAADDHKAFDKHLALASAYATDRRFLYDFVESERRKPQDENEEPILDLSDFPPQGELLPLETAAGIAAVSTAVAVTQIVDDSEEETESADLEISINEKMLEAVEDEQIDQATDAELPDLEIVEIEEEVEAISEEPAAEIKEIETEVEQSVIDRAFEEQDELLEEEALAHPEFELEESSDFEEAEPELEEVELEVLNAELENVEEIQEEAEGLHTMTSEEKPVAKEQAFASWLKQLNAPFTSDPILVASDQEEELEEDLDPESARNRQNVQAIAEASLRFDNEMISETLAHILALQGKDDKALAMYQKLAERYPEKSRYFAALIENLRQDDAQ